MFKVKSVRRDRKVNLDPRDYKVFKVKSVRKDRKVFKVKSVR